MKASIDGSGTLGEEGMVAQPVTYGIVMDHSLPEESYYLVFAYRYDPELGRRVRAERVAKTASYSAAVRDCLALQLGLTENEVA